MSDSPLPQRNIDWRDEMFQSLSSIHSDIAHGFMSPYGDGAQVKFASRLLSNLSEQKRKAIWEIAFYGLKDEMELAWLHMDPRVVIRRQGGQGHLGTLFTFNPSNEDAVINFVCIARTILEYYSGPYVGVTLVSMLTHIDFINKETDNKPLAANTIPLYEPGYLACVVLNQIPEDQRSKEIVRLCENHLINGQSYRFCQTFHTAIFCSDRTDLWKSFLQKLADRPKDDGMFLRFFSGQTGSNPSAVLAWLKTIHDHNLLQVITKNRASIGRDLTEAISGFFGIPGQWHSKHWSSVNEWLGRWIKSIETRGQERKSDPSDPVDELLWLWAEALFDGYRVLMLINDPQKMNAVQKIAAVHLLMACPAERRQMIVYRYATCSDLAVANIASSMLCSFHDRYLERHEQQEMFELFARFFAELPENAEKAEFPEPFYNPKLDLTNHFAFIASNFPDGVEDQIEELLPQMDSFSRCKVVKRLNRYRSGIDWLLEMECAHNLDEMRRVKEDHIGEQTVNQRRLLLNMLNDRDKVVVESAAQAVKGLQLHLEEMELIRPLIKAKNPKKKEFVVNLLSEQSHSMLEIILPSLMLSKVSGERSVGEEVSLRIKHNLS